MPPQRLPVQPQKNPPKQKIKAPRAAAPAAACVAGRSLACERIPLRHRSNLQRKKQHRHSGIFRVADLRPGTMPRGKYPESPAPAGSHALISRTPTPGGMLHANLGLPRPPPRNFQPPLPQQPPKTNPTAPPQCPSRAVASRQRSRNAGGMRRLAAEIPDIFIPLSRNDVRNDDGGILSHALPRPTHAPATAPSPTAKESPKTKN